MIGSYCGLCQLRFSGLSLTAARPREVHCEISGCGKVCRSRGTSIYGIDTNMVRGSVCKSYTTLRRFFLLRRTTPDIPDIPETNPDTPVPKVFGI